MRNKFDTAHYLTRRQMLTGIGATGLAVSGIGLLSGSAFASQIAAENFVEATGDELIAAATDGSANAFRTLLDAHIDMDNMATFGLGRYRDDLTGADKTEYLELVAAFMANTMSYYSDKFIGIGFDINRSRASGDGYIVETKMKFLGGRNHERVNWKVEPHGSTFKVIDIYFKQLWLAVVLRDTFTTEIQNNGGNASAILPFLRSAANSGSGTTF